MSDYDDTNSGVLFHNDKEGNDKRPDYKGKLNVEGKEYELAGWKRIAKSSGKAFLSVKISEPFNKDDVTDAPNNNVPTDDEDFNNLMQSIPF